MPPITHHDDRAPGSDSGFAASWTPPVDGIEAVVVPGPVGGGTTFVGPLLLDVIGELVDVGAGMTGAT